MLREDKLPPIFSEIIEDLKKEGVFLDETHTEVKSFNHFERRAITHINEAITYVGALCRLNGDFVSEAPNLLKRIKIAALETGKAASITRSQKALKCSEIAQRICDQSHEYVHERTLSDMIDSLKKEGLFGDLAELKVRSSEELEEQAIIAVNEELRNASALYNCHGDFAAAVRILEKIQVAAATAERAALKIRSQKALKCNEIAQRLSEQSREYFHELKDHMAAVKQRVA